MYYDLDGAPIDFTRWAAIHSDRKQKILKQETINGKLVSTVYLGINHNYGEGEPLIFETMIFPEGEWLEDYCERYATKAQALEGHERAVALIKGEQK